MDRPAPGRLHCEQNISQKVSRACWICQGPLDAPRIARVHHIERQGDRGVSVWVPRPGLMVGPRFQKDFQRPAMRNSVEGHVSARTVGHQATRPGTARLTGQRMDGEGERPGTPVEPLNAAS